MSTSVLVRPPSVVDLPLTMIVPSETNQRHVRNEAADKELSDSIKLRGVVQNIVVRPMGKKYQIVCGHRRFDASKAAGKETIPAVVRELSDLEALEIQNIENLQREGLDPIDGAMAAIALVEAYRKAGIPSPMLNACAKLQLKERSLYNLMSVAQLIEPAQTLLRSGKLSISAAYEIAAQTPEAQKRTMQWLKDNTWGSGDDSRFPSVRSLQQYIRDQQRKLAAAPWKKDDAKLLPAAGACDACRKNTAVNPLLGGDAKHPMCTDAVCYEQKMEAHLVQIVKETDGFNISPYHSTQQKGVLTVNNWRDATKGSCSYVTTGVYFEGPQKGQTRLVCVTNNLCNTHWKTQAAPKPERNRDIVRHRSATLYATRKTQLRNVVLQAQAAELKTKIKKLEHSDLAAVTRKCFERLQHDFKKPLVELMGWKPARWGNGFNYDKPAMIAIDKMKPAELSAFLVLVSIANEIYAPGGNSYFGTSANAQMKGFAKRHGVNLDKIARTAGAGLKAKWKAADQKKKLAAAKTKAKGKPQTAAKKAA